MATTKKAAKKPVKLTTAALKAKLRVHFHPAPKCKGSSHHSSCKGKGTEVACNQFSKFGVKYCVCTHVKI